MKFALDEIVYVLQGRGISTVWRADNMPKKTFEWQDRSLFHVPSNCYLQMTNMRGDKPVRILRYSYLPLATSLVTEPQFYFNNPFVSAGASAPEAETYSEAKLVENGDPALAWAAAASIGMVIFSPTWPPGIN